ncbi:hypothetical protein [Thiothrix sp.]|uniref:hypothetical protein n=1 Tax=Thiothrix sp. TaxID=1032 RepID=UPI0025796EA8|nr:hypothetical protein [Thiothrix sp.]
MAAITQSNPVAFCKPQHRKVSGVLDMVCVSLLDRPATLANAIAPNNSYTP